MNKSEKKKTVACPPSEGTIYRIMSNLTKIGVATRIADLFCVYNFFEKIDLFDISDVY